MLNKNKDMEQYNKYKKEVMEIEGYTEEEAEIICYHNKRNKFTVYIDTNALNLLYGDEFVKYNKPLKRMEVYNRYIGRLDFNIPNFYMEAKKDVKPIFEFCKSLNTSINQNIQQFFEIDPNFNDESKSSWYDESRGYSYESEPSDFCPVTHITCNGLEKLLKCAETMIEDINFEPVKGFFDNRGIRNTIVKQFFKRFNFEPTKELEEYLDEVSMYSI